MPRSLAGYLALDYPLRLIPDPSGGYIFEYPDLPGCIGQVDSLEELPENALEARSLWFTVALERGREIHEPSNEFSGKFMVRIGRSLHRELSVSAESDGVSLNQYVVRVLSERNALIRVDRRLDEVCERLEDIHPEIRIPDYTGVPRSSLVVDEYLALPAVAA